MKYDDLESQIILFGNAKKHYQDEEFEQAFSLLSKLMEDNFPPAYFLTSLFYARGHYVIKNRQIAVNLAQKGVNLGHVGCKALAYRYKNTSVGLKNFIRYQIGIFPLLMEYLFVLISARTPSAKVRILL